jgi:hypothetical protein
MSQEQNKSSPTLVEVFTNLSRAIARPAVTIIFAAVIAQVVVQGINPPQWFLALASACILWWFGDRTVQHIKTKTPIASGTKTPTESGEKKEQS